MIPQPIDQVPLFTRLSHEERELVTARLHRRQAAPNELIITEGAPSDAMFVITSGRVKLEGANVNSTITLANLSAGSLLGEEDLLLDRPYSSTARAAATTQLYVLSRTDLEDLIGQYPSIGLKFSAALGLRIPFLEQYLIHHRLRNTELLSALSDTDLTAIASKLDFHTVSRGDVIVEAGGPGDTAYFIEEGQARLILKSSEGDTFEELDEGALFGHTSLITGKPYPATVRAVTDVSLWALTRNAYEALIREHSAIKLAFSRALAESLSNSDQTEAMDRLRQLQLFSDVPTEALSALTARLVLRHFPAGETIFTEGTPGDAMYIVDSGEVRLMENSFSDAKLLERMRSGESFGEMALLTGRTRGECARAASDATLWVLYKTDFDDVMVQYPEISVSLSRALTERLSNRQGDFVIRHLRRIDMFSNLASSELQQISNQVQGLRFRPGEIVCFAGQPAQTLYMIEKGEIKRIAAGPNGEPMMLDILGPGDAIGVQEIVQNSAYLATAQAIGEIELWTIDKPHFQRMMETFPALALTITRQMADQLMRSQQMPPPPMPGQPRGGMPTRGPSGTLRATAPMPPRPQPRPANIPPSNQPRPGNVPPPGARIQQPRSGARPIKPAPKKPTAPITPAPIQPTANFNMPPVAPGRPSGNFNVPPTAPITPANTSRAASHMPHIQPPHMRAPHIPRPQMPHMQAPHVQRPHTPGFLTEFRMWLANMTWGARLRVLATGSLLIWLVFVAFPITTVTTVSSAVGGLQLSNQSGNSSGGSQPPQLLRSSSNNGTGNDKVAYAVASATPLPTKTPRPTATPKPKPTSAPLKRAPVVAPTATSVPQPVATLPPIQWDPRLGNGPEVLPHLENVRLIPAQVAHGQKFWRVIIVKFENIDESGNDHTIYVKILGEDGKRVDGKKLEVTSDTTGELFPDQPTEKSASDLCDCNYNYPLYGDGYDVKIIDQYPSDKVAGMIMPLRRHVVYRITYQLVTNP